MTNVARHTATQTSKSIFVAVVTGPQAGRAVATALLARGIPVRALVRTMDERVDTLRELGVEIVVGDFGNYRSLVAALDGAESAYFCSPVAAGVAGLPGYLREQAENDA